MYSIEYEKAIKYSKQYRPETDHDHFFNSIINKPENGISSIHADYIEEQNMPNLASHIRDSSQDYPPYSSGRLYNSEIGPPNKNPFSVEIKPLTPLTHVVEVIHHESPNNPHDNKDFGTLMLPNVRDQKTLHYNKYFTGEGAKEKAEAHYHAIQDEIDNNFSKE